MRTILTTVGTSLLTNAKRALKLPELTERQAADFLKGTSLAQASAETNSLSHLLQSGDAVALLHSETEEGRFCGRALQAFLEKQRYRVTLHEIAHLTYKEAAFKLRGLRELAGTLAGLIRRARREGKDVAINATGGFKAETAFATQVGQIFGVPVYYLHEAFSAIIEMPPTPIGWDYSLLAENEDFFAWLSGDIRKTTDVDRHAPSLPLGVRLLLAEEEGYTFLSALGEAYFEAYQERLEEAQAVPLLLSAKARKTYASAEPATQELFDKVLVRLRLRPLRINNSHQVRDCDCPVFPSGRYAARLFYSEDADGALKVMELALHDRSYDTLIARGVQRKNYEDFQPL